jgi:hypothetical protein
VCIYIHVNIYTCMTPRAGPIRRGSVASGGGILTTCGAAGVAATRSILQRNNTKHCSNDISLVLRLKRYECMRP